MPTLSLPLNISGTKSTPAPSDLLLIEQKEWKRGRLSKAGLVRYLARVLYSNTEEGTADLSAGLIDCNLNSDNMILLGLYVYPLRERVQYRLAATIGNLAGGEYEECVETESVQFTLTTSATLKHPASRLWPTRWLAGPWDAEGRRLSDPPLSLDSADRRILSTPVPIYGTALVTIAVPRWVWLLELDWDSVARPALLEGWSEFAVAWPPPGRPVALPLTAPPGAEEMALTNKGCGRSVSGTVGPAGNWPPTESGGKTKTIKCRYCELECDADE